MAGMRRGTAKRARNCDLVQHVTGDFGNLLAKGLLFLHSKTEAMPRCKPFLLACEQVNQAAFSRREISIYSPQANLGVRSAARKDEIQRKVVLPSPSSTRRRRMR